MEGTAKLDNPTTNSSYSKHQYALIIFYVNSFSIIIFPYQDFVAFFASYWRSEKSWQIKIILVVTKRYR